MSQIYINIGLGQDVLVWNRYVSLWDIEELPGHVGWKAWVQAGNEGSWIVMYQVVDYTNDFVICCTSLDPYNNTVGLMIYYGGAAPPPGYVCSGYPDYQCIESYAPGAYPTLAECLVACGAAPPPPLPPPPADKYYKCIDGKCTEVSYPTQYKNDPTCGGACKPAEEPIDWGPVVALGLAASAVIGALIVTRKPYKGGE